MNYDDEKAVATWVRAGLDALTWTATEPKPTVVAGPIQDSPDRFVGVMSYPGQQHGNNWQGDWRVQLRIRAPDYPAARKLADKVVGIVAPAGDQLATVSLSGGRMAPVSLATDILPLGPDAKGRYELSINLALTSVRA